MIVKNYVKEASGEQDRTMEIISCNPFVIVVVVVVTECRIGTRDGGEIRFLAPHSEGECDPDWCLRNCLYVPLSGLAGRCHYAHTERLDPREVKECQHAVSTIRVAPCIPP